MLLVFVAFNRLPQTQGSGQISEPQHGYVYKPNARFPMFVSELAPGTRHAMRIRNFVLNRPADNPQTK